MYVWNSSGDAKQFHNCKVYGNIVYNSKVAALSFSDKSMNNGFDFYNNIFVGKDSLMIGRDVLDKCTFEGNDWWSLTSHFNIHGRKNFKTWAVQAGKEQKNGQIVGLNINPRFKNPGKAHLVTASQVIAYYRLSIAGRVKIEETFKEDMRCEI